MNGKKLTKIIFTGFIALLACAILLPMVVNAGKQIERPLKIKSEGIISHVTGESYDYGTVTHGGTFTNVGQWWPDPDNPGVMLGYGTTTLANGEQWFWTSVNNPELNQGSVTINGGTGKFENCTGEFDFVSTSVPSEDGTYVILTYTGEGTITY